MKQGFKIGLGFIAAHAFVGALAAVVTVVAEHVISHGVDAAEAHANERDTDPLGKGQK